MTKTEYDAALKECDSLMKGIEDDPVAQKRLCELCDAISDYEDVQGWPFGAIAKPERA